MSDKRFICLTNGAVFDLNRVLVIARKELNAYIIVLDNSPVTVNADGADVDAIKANMPGLIVVESRPVVEAPMKTRLEVVED